MFSSKKSLALLALVCVSACKSSSQSTNTPTPVPQPSAPQAEAPAASVSTAVAPVNTPVSADPLNGHQYIGRFPLADGVETIDPDTSNAQYYEALAAREATVLFSGGKMRIDLRCSIDREMSRQLGISGFTHAAELGASTSTYANSLAYGYSVTGSNLHFFGPLSTSAPTSSMPTIGGAVQWARPSAARVNGAPILRYGCDGRSVLGMQNIQEQNILTREYTFELSHDDRVLRLRSPAIEGMYDEFELVLYRDETAEPTTAATE